jgi:hypothetical protein
MLSEPNGLSWTTRLILSRTAYGLSSRLWTLSRGDVIRLVALFNFTKVSKYLLTFIPLSTAIKTATNLFVSVPGSTLCFTIYFDDLGRVLMARLWFLYNAYNAGKGAAGANQAS